MGWDGRWRDEGEVGSAGMPLPERDFLGVRRRTSAGDFGGQGMMLSVYWAAAGGKRGRRLAMVVIGVSWRWDGGGRVNL